MLLAVLFFNFGTRAAQTDIVGGAGSGNFGTSVTVLPNGNIVVTDPLYDIPAGATDVGAVYLYDGATLGLISTLTGSTAGDVVGSEGVIVLRNGNFVVLSRNWNSSRGATTWGSRTNGVDGVVSAANSLVGTTANDRIGGIDTVHPLTNGDYVVRSTRWNGNRGSATWGSGTTGVSGPVSSSNSLVGTIAGEQIGESVTALNNGNYVVGSPSWNGTRGAATWGSGTGGVIGTISNSSSIVGTTTGDQIGASVTALANGNYVTSSSFWNGGRGSATWGNGVAGTTGTVSDANSIVGTGTSHMVSSGGVTALINGNYVVVSSSWNSNRGAVTWGSGASGTSGAVSASGSIIGVSGDKIGSAGVTALTNGNYVVRSQFWNGLRGAATWADGAIATTLVVSDLNSLVGSVANDRISLEGVTALTNGNYVVCSSSWNSSRGAATWGNGTSGIVGEVSSSNSLVGSVGNELVGTFVTALTNGNYVVRSPNWGAERGAVTWGNGATGSSGAVSDINSLVGSNDFDNIGGGDVAALTNGNYVVVSPNWDNTAPTAANAGAVTFGNGSGGTVGPVSSSNSLVGTSANDNIGGASGGGVNALTNGNFVVRSPNWDNSSPAATNAGAATFGNGTTGVSGAVSGANSIVGSTSSDGVTSGGVTELPNGNYVVVSPSWDRASPSVSNAGGYTFGNGVSGTFGPITAGTSGGNSVVGAVGSGVNTFAYDPTRNRLFVGRRPSNTVSVLFFDATATVDGGSGSNAATWGGTLPNALVNGIVPNGITVNLDSVMSVGQIAVECGGALTGGSSSAYIIGSVRKGYCSSAGETFLYPLGDSDEYSPMRASNVTGTGNLTASVNDSLLPGLLLSQSASRLWSLSGGGITTDLSFTYTDADINGTETAYKVYRRFSLTTTEATPSTINAATNTATVTGVSSYSDWAVGNIFAPSAAGVSVSGRVATSNGAGLRNAIVQLTGSDGITRRTVTSSFGYYRFDEVGAGRTYVIGVASKRYTFVPRSISVADELTDVDFIAQ